MIYQKTSRALIYPKLKLWMIVVGCMLISLFLTFTLAQCHIFLILPIHNLKLSTVQTFTFPHFPAINHPHFTLDTFLITSPLSHFSTFTLSHFPKDAGQYCSKHSKHLRDWSGWIGSISECFGTLLNHLSLLRNVL